MICSPTSRFAAGLDAETCQHGLNVESFIGSLIVTCALALLLSTPLACAQAPTTPTTRTAPALQPAATPGEALERAMRAIVYSDEAGYRRAVDLRSPHGYSEGYARLTFASARLRKAVRENDVTARRLREAGWDPNETLMIGIADTPTAAQWEAIHQGIQAIAWEVDGSVALAKGTPAMFSGGTQGETSVERSGDGWIVVIADPVDSATPEEFRQVANRLFALSAAIDAATGRVKAGKLKTIREVNDFVDAEWKKAQQPK